MLIEDIRPSTLVGIKRLARQISKAKGVSHTQALQLAANAASFENFEHARSVMGDKSDPGGRGHQLFLTSYWTDRETYDVGRETFEIWLSRPLSELCTKPEMKLVRGLCNLRLAAPDHLVKDSLCPSQKYARDQLCQSVRALRFMEVTGLRPCDYQRAQNATKGLDGDLPENDHSSDWFDPVYGQFILVDEPYSRAVVSPERAEWAARNNWNLRASSWPGIYFPDRCAFFVASDAAGKIDFDDLLRKIDAIPDPPTTDNWKGASARDHALFLSPLAATAPDKRRAKAKGTIIRQPSRKTLPYARDLIGRARKPNGTMSLTDHQRAGNMIKAVLQSQHKPWAVNSRMDRLRSTLVDWLYEDIPHSQLAAMYDPIDVYYGGISDDDCNLTQASSALGVVDILTGLRVLLTAAYPDCEPLRRMMRKVETSLSLAANALAHA